jgi:hypothetical protein
MGLTKTKDPADVLLVLESGRKWLSKRRHWTTVHYRVPMWAPWGSCKQTCGVGALMRADALCFAGRSKTAFGPARQALADALGDEPVMVNDGPDGYERIVAGYDTAIERLEALVAAQDEGRAAKDDAPPDDLDLTNAAFGI